jgi:hypothetical protein
VADTIFSTVQNFLTLFAANPTGAPTPSVIADGVFKAVVLTWPGGHTATIRDGAMSAGSTPLTVLNLWKSSWNQNKLAQYSLIGAGLANSTIASNYGAAASYAITAPIYMAPYLTDYGHNSGGGAQIAGGLNMSVFAFANTLTSTGDAMGYSWLGIGGGSIGSGHSGYETGEFNVGAPIAASYTQSKMVYGNWGRAGMIVPDLGVAGQGPKITVRGKACSELQKMFPYVAPTDSPNTWLMGPYGEYYFCPESLDILYLQASQQPSPL